MVAKSSAARADKRVAQAGGAERLPDWAAISDDTEEQRNGKTEFTQAEGATLLLWRGSAPRQFARHADRCL